MIHARYTSVGAVSRNKVPLGSMSGVKAGESQRHVRLTATELNNHATKSKVVGEKNYLHTPDSHHISKWW